MKKELFFLPGIISLALLSVLIFAGCPQTGGGDPPKTQYTVSFDGGDATGDPPPSQKVNEGDAISLPEPDDLTAPAGKEFDGWKAGGTGTSRKPGYSYTVTQNVEFVAQWKGIARTVTFDADGGSPATSSQKVNSGEAIGTLPSNPTKTGSVFDGWYTDRNGGGSSFTASTVVTADITVYAKWNTANQTPQFKVTFNTNEGAASTSTEKAVTAAGTVESMPSNPTRTGYTFEGWNTAQDGGGTAFTATTPVTGNTTVYAKWKSANPLIGAWMSPDSTSPSHFVVFTDSTMYFSYAIVRSSPRTTFINTALSTIKLTDNNGYEKTYNYQLAGNKLVVKKFANDNDMTFKRREGSKKTGIEDLWIPEDLSSENQWTYLLLIRETGQGNDVLYNYRIGDYWSMDTYTYEPASSGGRIQWTNLSSTPTSFNLSEDRKTLRISLPSLSSYTGQELTFVSTTWY